ncbi:MAG: PAS domain S-box protein [candidate division Zixibacteria bacterium]|nr:PAS domain S-box protein [candidate division Zixibacteria bacterium]
MTTGAKQTLRVTRRDESTPSAIHPESTPSVNDVNRLRSLFEATFDGIVFHEGGKIIDVNPTFERMIGYARNELIGTLVTELASSSTRSLMEHNIRTRNHGPYEAVVIHRNGSMLDVEIIAKEHEYMGRLVRVAAFRDITERKKAAQVLEETHARLLTEQLTLRRKNIALKEILSQIEHEKSLIKRSIQANINRVIMPIIQTLHQKANSDHVQYITLLEDALKDISSPFIRDLETNHTKLTPRELEICNMIKNGMSSKDIAVNLGISSQTVDKQRTHIRKKLALTKQGVNLVSFLKSLPDS